MGGIRVTALPADAPPWQRLLVGIRAEQRLSQVQLAGRLGATRQQVQDWEAGRREPPVYLYAALRLLLVQGASDLPADLIEAVRGSILQLRLDEAAGRVRPEHVAVLLAALLAMVQRELLELEARLPERARRSA